MDDTKTEHAVQHNTVPPRSRQARKTKSSNAKSRKKTASLQPGTKVPKLKGDFQKVAFEYGYTRFLRRFYSMNKEINRATAEAEWAKLIKARWMDWKKEMPELERRAELDRALSQIGGSEFFDVERYWSNVNFLGKGAKGVPAIHTATGLKLPRYKEDFLFITYKFGYKKFLRDIDFRNGPVLDVSKAEATWKYLIYAKWNSWLSTLPLADKEAALQMALGQVKGYKGFYPGQIDEYWRLKIERFSKPENQSNNKQSQKAKSLEDEIEALNKLDSEHYSSTLSNTRKRTTKKFSPSKKYKKGGCKVAKPKPSGGDVKMEGGEHEVETTSVFDFNDLAQALP